MTRPTPFVASGFSRKISSVRARTGAGLLALACLTAAGMPARPAAQARQTAAPAADWPPRLSGPAAGEVEIVPVQGNVFMIAGAGGNITVQAGHQGVLLVDTGTAAMSAKVIAAIQSISKRPLRYIVNTTHLADHTGGNAAIAPTGEIIPFREPNYTAGPQGALDVHKASVIAYYTVFHRMAGATGEAPTPEVGWPDNTYSIAQKRLHFNGEAVVIQHLTANTEGNSVVFFRKSDVVSAGDLVDLTQFPRIDVEGGGSLQAIVDSLNKLIEITVPEANAGGGTQVVPGHGRVGDHAEVVYQRDMMAVIRDRMADMLERKMTLAQVKAAGPAREYEARYGRTTGPWTTEMFVEAAYASLSRK
jgi:glyoxylase-like metal-dependent hydrolase (beta-lactamase superfamily II)